MWNDTKGEQDNLCLALINPRLCKKLSIKVAVEQHDTKTSQMVFWQYFKINIVQRYLEYTVCFCRIVYWFVFLISKFSRWVIETDYCCILWKIAS